MVLNMAWPRTLLLLAAAAISVAPQTPLRPGGTIRGRVAVPNVPASLTRPTVTEPATTAQVVVNRRRVVVYLESAPRQAFGELPLGRARMDQRNEQFVPRLIAIAAGTVVDFPNNDKTFHNVFSLSRVRTFDLGRFAPGRNGSVRFDRPGIVPVFCDIHAHMSANILVFSHPFYAVSDDDGRYEIAGVPSGSYTLVVWSELGSAPARRITVADAGTVEADFQIGREP
jgi:plastocyanin